MSLIILIVLICQNIVGCSEGSIRNATGDCEPCPQDTYAFGGKCLPCLPGSHTSEGNYECYTCPEGQSFSYLWKMCE